MDYDIIGFVNLKSLVIKAGARVTFSTENSKILIRNGQVKIDGKQDNPIYFDINITNLNKSNSRVQMRYGTGYYLEMLNSNKAFVKICHDLNIEKQLSQYTCNYAGFHMKHYEPLTRLYKNDCSSLKCPEGFKDISSCTIDGNIQQDYIAFYTCYGEPLKNGIIIHDSSNVEISHLNSNGAAIHIVDSVIETLNYIRVKEIQESDPALFLFHPQIEKNKQINNINIEDNLANGLVIDSSERTAIHSLYARNNSKSGSIIRSTRSYLRNLKDPVDACFIKCTNCTEEDIEFPIVLYTIKGCDKFDKKTFTAKNGKVFMIKSYNITKHPHQIKDGSNSQILRFGVSHNSHYESKSNSIEVYFINNYNTNEATFLLIDVVEPGSTISKITNSAFEENYNGLEIINNFHSLEMNNIQAINNLQIGISISLLPKYIGLSEVQARNNTIGIKLNEKGDIIKMERNDIQSNSKLGTIIQVKFGNHGKTRIIGNEFIDNKPVKDIDSQNFHFFPDFVSSILKISSTTNLQIYDNIFHNPKFSYELILQSPRYDIVNVSGNFWGDFNPWTRIIGYHFAYHHQPVLIETQFSDIQRTTLKEVSFPWLNNDKFLIGDLSGEVTIKSGKYILLGPVRLLNDCSLTIEDNVEIEARPYSGIEVYGRLDIKGSNHGSIQIKMNNSMKNEQVSLKAISLNEEVVEIQFNSTSYGICYVDNDITLYNALCLTMGFYNYSSISYRYSNSGESMIVLNCPTVYYETCTKEIKHCQKSLKLKCNVPNWGGVAYLIGSEPSRIAGLRIENAGLFNYDLYFEQMQQMLENVEIISTSKYSIISPWGQVHDEVILKNTKISKRYLSYTNEILIRAPRTTIEDCTFNIEVVNLQYIRMPLLPDTNFLGFSLAISQAKTYPENIVNVQGKLVFLIKDFYSSKNYEIEFRSSKRIYLNIKIFTNSMLKISDGQTTINIENTYSEYSYYEKAILHLSLVKFCKVVITEDLLQSNDLSIPKPNFTVKHSFLKANLLIIEEYHPSNKLNIDLINVTFSSSGLTVKVVELHQFISLNLENCTFEQKDIALSIPYSNKGPLQIVSNIMKDIQNVNFGILLESDYHIQKLNKSIAIHENTFHNLITKFNVVKMNIYEGFIQFQQNVINNCSAPDSLIHFTNTGKFQLKKTFSNNQITLNNAKYSLKLDGQYIPEIFQNVFSNDEVDYEIRLNIVCYPLKDENCQRNATHNFFKSTNPYERIYDGRLNGFLSTLKLSPSYLNIEMTEEEDYNWPMRKKSVLQGFYSESLEINDNVDILRNTVINGDLKITITKNIIVSFKNCSILMIYGDLIIEKSPEFHIQFSKFINGKIFRLSEGYLKVYENDSWFYISFPSLPTKRYIFEGNLICKALCLGEWSDNSVNYLERPEKELIRWQLDCETSDNFENCSLKERSDRNIFPNIRCKKSAPWQSRLIIFGANRVSSNLQNSKFHGVELLLINSKTPNLDSSSFLAVHSAIRFYGGDEDDQLKIKYLNITHCTKSGIELWNSYKSIDISNSAFHYATKSFVVKNLDLKDVNDIVGFSTPINCFSPIFFCSLNSIFELNENDSVLWLDYEWFQEYQKLGCSATFKANEENIIQVNVKIKLNFGKIFRLFNEETGEEIQYFPNKVFTTVNKIIIEVLEDLHKASNDHWILLLKSVKPDHDSCDFETPICNWKNHYLAFENIFKPFLVVSSTDPTSVFALKSDANFLGMNGHYLLLKGNGHSCSSYPVPEGSAVLVSRIIKPEDDICHVYFHAYKANAPHTMNIKVVVSIDGKLRNIVSNNVFINPHLTYEISTNVKTSASKMANCMNNWWGTTDISLVDKKLYDGRKQSSVVTLTFQPLSQTQPTHFISSTSCLPGWRYIDGNCYFLYSGIGKREEAQNWCISHSAYLVKKETLHSQESIQNLLSFTELNGSLGLNDIWTSDDLISNSGMNDSLKPWLCSKTGSGLCIDNCNGKGRCFGSKCLCVPGWKGKSCLEFSCREVSECSSRGECIGPNICKCSQGWEGKNCARSKCPRYLSCQQCTKHEGCGWCDSRQKCMPGSPTKPYGNCTNWFYRECISLAPSRCSKEIKIIDCDKYQCSTRRYISKGLCQQCRDLEVCFTNSTCRTWIEKICINGYPRPDLLDPNRFTATEIKDNVVLVKNTTKIYKCIGREQIKDMNNKIYEILIVPSKKVKYQIGVILLSSQSGGIVHLIVDSRQSLANYTIYLTKISDPINVLKYAHFKTKGRFQYHKNPRAIDSFPRLEKVRKFTKSNQNYVDMGTNEFFKCSGQGYSYRDETVWSHFIITKYQNYKVGDVLYGNRSRGFLESVLRTGQNREDLFVETELSDCSRMLKPNQIDLDTIINLKSDLECQSMDGIPSLHYLEREKIGKPIHENDIIVGRSSLPVLGFIINITIFTNEWNFVEVINLETISKDLKVNDVKIEEINLLPRNKQYSTINDKFNEVQSTQSNIRLENDTGNVNINSLISISAEPLFELKISPQKFYLDHFRVSIIGKVNFQVDTDVNVAKSVKNFTIFQRDTHLLHLEKDFRVKIAGVSIPGSLVLHRVSYGPIFFNSARSVQSTSSTVFNINFDIGATLSKETDIIRSGEGLTASIKDSKISGSWLGISNIESFLDIGFSIRWPYWPDQKNVISKDDLDTTINHDSIYNWLKEKQIDIRRKTTGKLIKDKELYVIGVYELQQQFLQRFGYCDSHRCTDISKPNSARQTKFYGQFSVAGLSKKFNYPLKEKFNELESLCLRRSRTFRHLEGCCLCTDKYGLINYGRLDPITGECMCRCFCNGPKAQISWKTQFRPCQCCPDGSAIKDGESTSSCLCTCEDGTVSTLGRNGCICEKCVPCWTGEIPVRRPDGICQCPSTCGINSVCTSQRKGDDCNQPYCFPDQSCSSNGKCTLFEGCQARCVCNRFWQGPTCNFRNPTRGSGDPHLETLDGNSYDFFDIGQYWGCRTPTIGYQYRFFGLNGTSFIGGMAIRLGNVSVLTINTLLKSSSADLPLLRLDGDYLSNITMNSTFTFDNVTIRLDISLKKTNVYHDDPTILIISIKYSTGASLSVVVSYSKALKRQYLTSILIATADMMNKTSGLCGFMNDNENDDFKGPYEQLYSDARAFAKSWKIKFPTRLNGGTAGSWSWTESNFHKDDSMDLSYFDPSHQPVYALQNFSKDDIENAHKLCSGKQLTKIEIDQCIFDIVYSGDVSMACQFVWNVKLCPNQCLSRGTCLNGTCICVDGWSGEYCEQGDCGLCVNGNCSEGFCICNDGFEGPACEDEAVCEMNCSYNGVCVKSGVCRCNEGWLSPNCTELAQCSLGCGNHGLCIDDEKCKCNLGYNGTSCSTFSCEVLNHCSDHGFCLDFDTCLCFKGWTGESCSIPICDNQCSGNGECNMPGNCSCQVGYSGSDCSMLDSCPQVRNCTNNGLCVNETICACDEGFDGIDCSVPVCTPPCSENGTCIEPDRCTCNMGYTGKTCTEFSCESLQYCSTHGNCTSFDQCECDENWTGPLCDIPLCKAVSSCSKNGQCIDVNTCICDRGFEGVDCSSRVSKNMAPPKFFTQDLNIEVKEDIQVGEYLKEVYANDTDPGEAGTVSYFLLPTNAPVTIDSRTGILKTLGKLQPGQFHLEVVASDNGIPAKSSSKSLKMTVLDINECATIYSPLNNFQLTINSSLPLNSTLFDINVTDSDLGIFSEIFAAINFEGSILKPFLDIANNSLTLKTLLTPLPHGQYRVKLIVFDVSDEPCSSTITFTINILPPYADNGNFGENPDTDDNEKTITLSSLATSTLQVSTQESSTNPQTNTYLNTHLMTSLGKSTESEKTNTFSSTSPSSVTLSTLNDKSSKTESSQQTKLSSEQTSVSLTDIYTEQRETSNTPSRESITKSISIAQRAPISKYLLTGLGLTIASLLTIIAVSITTIIKMKYIHWHK
ncbi:DgyrCDS11742 [Dimorphilus gyrociliatus]|uniref:DgyrCDS11742 n=1 Tax=Dimorphilus gyrociliatus TaxID=2664684 RepID=A0A7I8W896_9ANNE|nr:DgyrCDS11742 [Dimorphilus gyrociliatus]